ncbi:hypothetical protein ACVXG7_01775 [Enterobacter hormaechei]
MGRDNRLAYRIARRDAHNTDARAGFIVSNMSTEPRATAEIRDDLPPAVSTTRSPAISLPLAPAEKLTNPGIPGAAGRRRLLR